MKENWKKAYDWVRQSEGGNDDDPHDHGGRTSRGITQREYDAWRAENKKPHLDVWKASEDEIRQIYREGYWDPLGDTLPTGVDYMYYDMAVNAGPNRATKLLQRALGVTPDGRVGPVTRQAIKNADARSLIQKYALVKRQFYIGLGQPRFLRGWLSRVAFVSKNANTLLA